MHKSVNPLFRQATDAEIRAALLTPAQRERMQANFRARRLDETLDPQPEVKLFLPDARVCWLLTELDETGDLAYGLIDAGIGWPELGIVSLTALAQVRGPNGYAIVADPQFIARQSLSAYAAEAVREGSVCD